MAIDGLDPLDRTFHALGDPSRRRILTAVSRRGRCGAGELVELFDFAQPTISKHLRVLEKAGLLTRSVVGRNHFFTVDVGPMHEADAWLTRHLDFWRHSLGMLEILLDSGTVAPPPLDDGDAAGTPSSPDPGWVKK